MWRLRRWKMKNKSFFKEYDRNKVVLNLKARLVNIPMCHYQVASQCCLSNSLSWLPFHCLLGTGWVLSYCWLHTSPFFVHFPTGTEKNPICCGNSHPALAKAWRKTPILWSASASMEQWKIPLWGLKGPYPMMLFFARSSLKLNDDHESSSGWWCNNHLEKYERQWDGWHPIYEMENNPNVPNISKPPTSHPIALIIKPGFSHGSDPMTFRERNELGTPTSESRIETCTAKIHTPLYGMYIVGISFNSTYINIYILYIIYIYIYLYIYIIYILYIYIYIYRERERKKHIAKGFSRNGGMGPPFFIAQKLENSLGYHRISMDSQPKTFSNKSSFRSKVSWRRLTMAF